MDNEPEKEANEDIKEEVKEGPATPACNYAIVPPDGGWGWVIVVASFYIQLVCDGIMLSFGMIIIEMASDYGVREPTIALIGSLMYGSHMITGPLCATLIKSLGDRITVTIGSFLSAGGLLTAYFRLPYQLLYFTCGVLTGTGLGFGNMSSLVITSIYFTQRRILALGIVVCGTASGTIVFSTIATYILMGANDPKNYTKVILIESAFAFSMCIASLTFIPLKPIKLKMDDQSFTSVRITVDNFHIQDGGSSNQSIENHIFYISNKTALDAASLISMSSLVDQADQVMEALATTVTHAEVPDENENQNNRRSLKNCCCFRCCRRSKKSNSTESDNKNELKTIDKKGKKDEKKDMQVIIESDQLKLGFCKRLAINYRKFRKIMTSFINFGLLRSCRFTCFCLTGAFCASAVYTFFTYEKVRLSDENKSDQFIFEYMLVVGSANIVSRLLLGCATFFPTFNYHAVNILGTAVGGFGLLAAGANRKSKTLIYFTGITFAFAFACFSLFNPVILYELVGFEDVVSATGISLLITGAASACSPFLTGLVGDYFGDHVINYYFTGTMFLIAAVLYIFITGRKGNLRSN